ncbi:MAG: hypothetical protein MOB07_23640 [Acidobacteria bacterium]|nr:hypothetical protein [Acidobacteriota bacterium]
MSVQPLIYTVQPGLRLFLALLLMAQPMTIDQPITINTARASTQAPLVLTAVLDQLQARLDALLNSARSAGTELLLVLGAQVAAEISLARQQLHTELDYQRERWSEAANALVNNITESISNLENQAFGQAQDLINQAQLIAISLPFADKSPHVRAFSPIVSFRPPSGVDDLVFTVAGVFPDVGKEGYDPTLTLDLTSGSARTPKKYPASSANAFLAQFHVPQTDLAFPTGSAARSIQAHVNIPYRKRCALLFNCKRESSFPVLIGLLPRSPGNLHVSFSTTTEEYETKMATSHVMHQDASRGDDRNHPQTFAPDPGYEIIPESVRITVLGANGDWSLGGNCSTRTAACWQVTTVQHHCLAFICPQGHDGAVNFRLSFAEKTLVTKVQNGQKDIPIAWNQTSLYTFPSQGALTWTATYTDFNNRSVSFGSNNTQVNSPYLKATSVASKTIAFSVYPFTVDAGSSLSILPPEAYEPNSPLNVKLGQRPENSRNPLTPTGFSALKAYAAQALAASFPASRGRVVVSNRTGGYSTAAFEVAPGGNPPPAPSPADAARQEALNALIQSASDPNSVMK